MKKFLLFFLVSSFLLFPLMASAQWGAAKSGLKTVGTATQLEGNLETSVGTVISGALALVGTIFLILTVYAGILWMLAQGNEEKVNKAKDIITAAIIGLVITMAAYAITSFVTTRLGGSGSGDEAANTPITTRAQCEAATSRNGACIATVGECAEGRTVIGACSDYAGNTLCCGSQ